MSTQLTKQLIKQASAEFIGTFFLVFLSCGAIILSQLPQYNFNPSLIGAIFGGTVCIMIYASGHISGAHFNPAVTLAFLILRKLPRIKFFTFITAQFLGAICASSIHCLIFDSSGHNFGSTQLSVEILPGFTLEVLFSFMLMLVISAVATDTRAKGEMAGLAIGLSVALLAWVGGPLTGASMNPARSLGPAILDGQLQNIWLYFLAPCLGTFLGAGTYELIRCHSESINDGGQGCC